MTKKAKTAVDFIVVKQVKSPIARNRKQKTILVGLGLNKIGRQKQLLSTPAILGMIDKVSHLVTIVEN